MIEELNKLVPDIEFSIGEQFCWSPKERKITYSKDQIDNEGCWALLHETGHALLGHLSYKTDYELLKMEVSAWEKAKELANRLGIEIVEEHIQQCLDSYRDWLSRRSTCPACGTKALQEDTSNSYSCFNCHACWQVSPSRFCRAYRIRQPIKEPVLF
jgi:NADH pyrophosphatase NudC (nudix superfamily)